MNFTYRELYLEDAMRNLAEMTEYAHDACGVDLDRALDYFVISGYANRFQIGDPCIVSGTSGTELYRYAAEKCGDGMEEWPDPVSGYDLAEYYWIGYILAYFQWRMNLSFASIFYVIKEKDLLRMYPALHTASEERAAEELWKLYHDRRQFGRLSEYRKRLGMTQKQLAEASGVNLRTLQQYEAGAKDISKAAAESVISLSEVLGVRPRELMPVHGFSELN